MNMLECPKCGGYWDEDAWANWQSPRQLAGRCKACPGRSPPRGVPTNKTLPQPLAQTGWRSIWHNGKERPVTEDPRIEAIARVCHEANAAYCDSIGDKTQAAWTHAPKWQRDSAIEGVKQALAGAGPRQLHESWLAHKAVDGWVYGAVKDAEAKTHPCMVDYDDLPEAQQRKDALFGAIVMAMRTTLGL